MEDDDNMNVSCSSDDELQEKKKNINAFGELIGTAKRNFGKKNNGKELYNQNRYSTNPQHKTIDEWEMKSYSELKLRKEP